MSQDASESIPQKRRFQFGDRVRHAKRPEWGIGTIIRTEDVALNGERSQRLTARFENGGLKTLNSSHADLELVTGESVPELWHDRPSVAEIDRMREAGWLSPLAERKLTEVMGSLPAKVRDPFVSLRRRLELTLDLYRFQRDGAGLSDWAVAQTGLKDPLSRFNRHELEFHFDRWACERDNHLARLLQEAQQDPAVVDAALRNAPPPAREAARKLLAVR